MPTGRMCPLCRRNHLQIKATGILRPLLLMSRDASTAKLVLLALSGNGGTRLRAAGVRAEVIAVGIKTYDLQYASHQMTLNYATNITIEIHRCPASYLTSYRDGTAIRHLKWIPAGSGTIRTCGSWICLIRSDWRKLKRWMQQWIESGDDTGNDAVMRAAFCRKSYQSHVRRYQPGKRTCGL